MRVRRGDIPLQIRQRDPVEQCATTCQMTFERNFKIVGQRNNSILTAFCVAYEERAVLEVKILDSQTHAFHEPEPSSIEKTPYDPVIAF